MVKAHFNNIVEEQITNCYDILHRKSDEYATSDMLHNFRTAAVLGKSSMRQALGGMMMKHTISIYDMIEDNKMHTLEQWNEKITDHINYLLILSAIIRDERIADLRDAE
jgi:hypothetical protein